jgi:hypothetical protein|tara:strand:+ start:368 stop:952 length:585 start_codon:yes stop_codon:yes gene_type:complete
MNNYIKGIITGGSLIFGLFMFFDQNRTKEVGEFKRIIVSESIYVGKDKKMMEEMSKVGGESHVGIRIASEDVSLDLQPDGILLMSEEDELDISPWEILIRRLEHGETLIDSEGIFGYSDDGKESFGIGYYEDVGGLLGLSNKDGLMQTGIGPGFIQLSKDSLTVVNIEADQENGGQISLHQANGELGWVKTGKY